MGDQSGFGQFDVWEIASRLSTCHRPRDGLATRNMSESIYEIRCER